jgi:hypothetical protein
MAFKDGQHYTSNDIQSRIITMSMNSEENEMNKADNSELIRIVLDNLQPVLHDSLNVIRSEY